MIDWFKFAMNVLWIVSLSLALAFFGFARWEASISSTKLSEMLKLPRYLNKFALAGILFCIGLAGVSTQWWEIAWWILMAVLIIFDRVIELYQKRRVNRSGR